MRTHSKRISGLVLFNIAILFIAFCAPLITGCKNFFIGPTLTTVTVAPSTPSIAVGKTQQMSATGTYDNGSTDTITDSASWASSEISIATASSKGLVTGVASGQRRSAPS